MTANRINMDERQENAKRKLLWTQRTLGVAKFAGSASAVTYTLDNLGWLDKAKDWLGPVGDSIIDFSSAALIDYTVNVSVKMRENMPDDPYIAGAAAIIGLGLAVTTKSQPQLEALDVELRGARNFASMGFTDIDGLDGHIKQQEKLFVAMTNDKMMTETLLGFSDYTILKSKPFRTIMDNVPFLSNYLGKQKGSYQDQKKLAELRVVSARFMGDVQSCPGAIGEALRGLPMFESDDVKAYMKNSVKFNELITDHVFTHAQLVTIMKDTLKIDQGALFDIDPSDPLAIQKKVAIESIVVETALNLGREFDRFNTVNAFANVMTDLHTSIQEGNGILENPEQMMAQFDKIAFMSNKFKHQPEFAKIHEISEGVYNKLAPYVEGKNTFLYHPRDLIDRSSYDILDHPDVLGDITPVEMFSHIIDRITPHEMVMAPGIDHTLPAYASQLQEVMLDSYQEAVGSLLSKRIGEQMHIVKCTSPTGVSEADCVVRVMKNLHVADSATPEQMASIKTASQLTTLLSQSHTANLLAVSNQAFLDMAPDDKYAVDRSVRDKVTLVADVPRPIEKPETAGTVARSPK